MPTEVVESLATSVLFIDSSTEQRTYWADQLKRCSPDYQIIEADDGQSGRISTGLSELIAWCWNWTCQIDPDSRYYER